MSLRIGHRGYLKLAEGFSEPRWREALVIGLQKQWIQTLVACSEEEAVTQQLSHIQVNGSFFALVEAEAHQLRLGVNGEFKNLEIDPKVLLREGNTLLQSDSELAYATASDPNPKADQRSKKTQRERKPRSSSEEETSEESSNEEGLELARSAWLGTGTGRGKSRKQSGSKKGKKSRFALIERKEKKKESLEEEEQEAVLKAAAKSGDTLQGLLALQLAQTLKSGKGRSNRRSSRRSSSVHSDDSSDSSEETSSSENRRARGHGKAIYDYHQSKKKMVRNPLKYVKKFVKEVEADLGAEGKPFKLTDHNLQPSDQFWSSAQSPEMSLLGCRDPRTPPAGGHRASGSTSSLDITSDAPSCSGLRSDGGMAPDSCTRSFQPKGVRGRPGVITTCDILPSQPSRTDEDHRDPSQAGRQSRGCRRRRQRRKERKEGQQGQGEGERPFDRRILDCSVTPDPHPKARTSNSASGAKPPVFAALQDQLQKSWGSFGRFLRVIKSSITNIKW